MSSAVRCCFQVYCETYDTLTNPFLFGAEEASVEQRLLRRVNTKCKVSLVTLIVLTSLSTGFAVYTKMSLNSRKALKISLKESFIPNETNLGFGLIGAMVGGLFALSVVYITLACLKRNSS